MLMLHCAARRILATPPSHTVLTILIMASIRPYGRVVGSEFGYRNVHLLKHQVVGTGSYGSVCHAQLDHLLCAAKCMHPALYDMRDPGVSGMLERFHSECEILSRIRHPNVVQYLGTATDPETQQPVLFMELLDCSLTHFLESQPAEIPIHLQINFSHDIALAVVFLHHNGIIHRDLTSNNVLLLGEIRAKVTDFGMSNLMENRKSTQTKCPGSVVYMPPEVFDDSPTYNEQIDVFSMGVLMVQIMTGIFPNPLEQFRRYERPDGQRCLLMPVPEIERRSEHINKIDRYHPLLPIAKHCLKDLARQRPSSDDLSQQINASKSTSVYQTSQQHRRRPERMRERGRTVERQESQESLRQLNHELVEALEEKEAMIQAQQQEAQGLIHQLQQKNEEVQRMRYTVSQQHQQQQGVGEGRREQDLILQPGLKEERAPYFTMEQMFSLQNQLSASQKSKARLEQMLRELEGRERHLQLLLEEKELASSSSSDWEYSGILYTPSYVKNTNREWNAVFALCPKSLTSMTTDLRKLVSEMFEAPFTSSAVGISFERQNTLTLSVPNDNTTRHHDIEFNINPPTIERDEVDLSDTKESSTTKTQAEPDDIYPPRIVLTIRPSPDTSSLLKCNLQLDGVHTRRNLILSTPTLLKPKRQSQLSLRPRREPDVYVPQVFASLTMNNEEEVEFKSMQKVFTGHVAVTAANNDLYRDSDVDNPVLEQLADLAPLMEHCGSQIPHKWRQLGIQLKIPVGELNALEQRAVLTPMGGVMGVLQAWQEHETQPTWRKLLKALRTKTVGQHVLAYTIQEQLLTGALRPK